MGVCSNCSSRTGFLSKARKCNECGMGMCGKCTEWILITPVLSGVTWTNAEVPICSPDCVLRSFKRIIQSLDRTSPVQLFNDDNSGVSIEAKSRKGAMGSYAVYNMKGTPQDAQSDHMIPEAQQVYDMIRQLLSREGFTFSESKEIHV